MEFNSGDRFYYVDVRINKKTDKMGTVIKKVYEGEYLFPAVYSVYFDDNPTDERRIGELQMMPDYEKLREDKINQLLNDRTRDNQ